YTHAMLEPSGRTFGGWLDSVPDTLTALLAETGRHYLPWVARATRDGDAPVDFAGRRLATTNFLNVARGVLLARYVAARSPALDAALARAGILRWFADFTDQATAIPDPAPLPRPADNQPFAAGS